MVMDWAKLRERIERNSMPLPWCGCRIWLGRCNADGYPRLNIRVSGEAYPFYAHRVSFEAHSGRRIKSGHQVDHILDRCYFTSCVNFDHLRELTPKQNVSFRELRRRRRIRDYAELQT